jgi:hypothetical protein
MSENHARAAPLANQRPDRRGQVRQVALLRIALLHAAGARDICIVRNVSPNGLSARVYRKLVPGDQVEVEFRSGELLAGSKSGNATMMSGLSFPRIDVNPVLASGSLSEPSRRRALPRIEVQCTGQLSTGPRSVDIVLRDISQGGANLESASPEDRLWERALAAPDLPPIAGVVRWSSGTKLGVSRVHNLWNPDLCTQRSWLISRARLATSPVKQRVCLRLSARLPQR